MDEVVKKIIESHQKSLQQRNIVADVVITGTLPEVEGDPRLLTQVFANILENAEQAISSVREKGAIRISLSQAGNNLLVVFADDGPGIPQEMVDKIYDPFFTTKRPGGGSGLGLTICLGVIKDHGGRIEVQTSEGAGTTFRIFLPAILERKHEAPNSTPARNASPVSLALSGRKLLIVDDEESIREIVQDGLSARGMHVECAASSEEALALLAGNTYDVVLCDFNLPGLSGEQLFEQLRAQSERFFATICFYHWRLARTFYDCFLCREGRARSSKAVSHFRAGHAAVRVSSGSACKSKLVFLFSRWRLESRYYFASEDLLPVSTPKSHT